MSDEQVVQRLDRLISEVSQLREEVGALKGWQPEFVKAINRQFEAVTFRIVRNEDNITSLSTWKERAVGVIIGAQAIGVILAGVVIRLMTKLGWL